MVGLFHIFSLLSTSPDYSHSSSFCSLSSAGHIGVVMDLSWAVSKTDRFASAGSDKKVLLWQVGQYVPLCWFDGHTNVVESLKFLTEDYLVSYGRDSFFLVWNTRDAPVVTDLKKTIVERRVRSFFISSSL